MPVISLRYRFRQALRAPAPEAYAWCTDFDPEDGALFSERTRRSVSRWNEDALVMTDTTYPEGRPRRIRRLVRLFPEERAWTNTHLDGPFRGSQYWYRVVADGPRRSHLEFTGLRLVTSPRTLSPTEVARRAEECRRSDSTEWRQRLAPALAEELRPPRRLPSRANR
jgi:hypothetical protein